MIKYCLAVDLATEQDYTAISLIEHIPTRTDFSDDNGNIKLRNEYHLRHLERLPLHTGYNEIIETIKMRLDHPELRGQTILAVDRTGVGNPVLTMMRNAGLAPIGVYITAGFVVNQSISGYNVPKLDLVSALSILMQSGRLHASPELGFQEELKEELQNFRSKKTTVGKDTASAWRESIHDDLVLAVSIGCYMLMKMNGEYTYTNVKSKKGNYDVFSALLTS